MPNKAQYCSIPFYNVTEFNIKTLNSRNTFSVIFTFSSPEPASFLGHVVGKRLQIKPSGSGDENVIFSSLEALARARYTQICSVQIWCKKVQTRRKSKAKIVNIAFAYRFTRGCKFVGKCGIYHLCL